MPFIIILVLLPVLRLSPHRSSVIGPLLWSLLLPQAALPLSLRPLLLLHPRATHSPSPVVPVDPRPRLRSLLGPVASSRVRLLLTRSVRVGVVPVGHKLHSGHGVELVPLGPAEAAPETATLLLAQAFHHLGELSQARIGCLL